MQQYGKGLKTRLNKTLFGLILRLNKTYTFQLII
jgi:hypothetical protein